jgi:hypothetical protein
MQEESTIPDPEDDLSDVDGCLVDQDLDEITSDEDLPAAEGGVAS